MNRQIPHFELQQRKDGDWGFRLRAANNEILFGSEGYKSRQGAEAGITAVKRAVSNILYSNTPTKLVEE